MVAVLVVNAAGLAIGAKLAAAGGDFVVFAPAALAGGGEQSYTRLGDQVERLFGGVDGFVFIMASGIAVRVLAPLLQDKKTDPGAVVVDEAGDFATSLVGGHEGGANSLAYRVAGIIGAEPVVSTGSEAAKDVVVGVGCRREAGADTIAAAVLEALARSECDISAVKALATIELKKDDDDLLAAAASLGLPVRFIDVETLRRIGPRTTASPAAGRAFGVDAVCEPASLAGGRGFELVLGKQTFPGVTVAVARRIENGDTLGKLNTPRCPLGAGVGTPRWSNKVSPSLSPLSGDEASPGRLAVVGIGQGGDRLTLEAQKTLDAATDIVGYRTYIRSIADHIGDRTTHEFGMGSEVERVRRAVELAVAGRKVALISSGDAGIYGMAGPLLEVLADSGLEIDVDIVPGVTAASAAAAAVGAPLMNDFAAVSLSDIMTPWAQIVRRLEASAEADLVVVLYNPKSSKRKDQFEEARQIFLKHRPPSTPAAVVRNAGQAPEAVITDLDGLAKIKIDMRCTVIIGNSQTRIAGGRLVTTRGYPI